MKSFENFISETKTKLVDHGHKMELGHIEARRHMKSRGDHFSGWEVRNKYDRYDRTDPLPTREHAKKVMRQWHSDDVASGKAKKYEGLDY